MIVHIDSFLVIADCAEQQISSFIYKMLLYVMDDLMCLSFYEI